MKLKRYFRFSVRLPPFQLYFLILDLHKKEKKGTARSEAVQPFLLFVIQD
jgi:hypothetical protein